LTFFNAAALFVLMGAEFLAMILIVVYVGAVAVMFLFVVMMLDINFTELRQGFLQYLPIGGLVGLVLLAELLIVLGGWTLAPEAAAGGSAPTPQAVSNTDALGQLIYTHYFYLFQASGVVLLIAMIGAIVLTFRRRPGVRRQNIGEQLRRHPEDSIEVRKIQTGKGI
jgi:NADH-quinone oxidoreductase subunit J